MPDADRLLAADWAGDRAYWSANPCPDCLGWVRAVGTLRRCLTCRPIARLVYDADELLAVSTWRQEVFAQLDLRRLVKPDARRVMRLYAQEFTPDEAVRLALTWSRCNWPKG